MSLPRIAQARIILERFEGRRHMPYMDIRGIWTIACGSITDLAGHRVTAETPPMTDAEIDVLLDREIAWAGAILEHHVKVKLEDNEWAALVSFVFNEGPGSAHEKDGFVVLKDGGESTMLRKLNAGDKKGAFAQLPLWNKSGGRVVPGLTRRRLFEQAVAEGRYEVRLPAPASAESPTA